jgi:Protein-L-isoaspartate carboxylmethyltransferase
MVDHQLRARGFADERVLAAMAAVPRELFVPDDARDRSYDDAALPIGAGQTISQPYMVALICSGLQVRAGARARCRDGLGLPGGRARRARCRGPFDRAGPRARRPSREALAAAGYADRVQVHVGDGTQGCRTRRRSRRCSRRRRLPGVPPLLYDQLAEGGRLVVPVGSRRDQLLVAVVRSPEGPATLPGVPCRFVPLVGADGF